MPDENREPEVKVTDRRRFSAEGEPRDDASEEAETHAADSAAASIAPSGSSAPEPPGEPLGTPQFTAGGQPSETAPPPPSAERSSGPEESAALPPPTFEFLVLSFRWQAELQLGLYSSPEDQKHPPDLEGARHTIDLLGMLQGKTRGNLTLDEQRLLENSLTELRFRYVQAVDRLTRKPT